MSKYSKNLSVFQPICGCTTTFRNKLSTNDSFKIKIFANGYEERSPPGHSLTHVPSVQARVLIGMNAGQSTTQNKHSQQSQLSIALVKFGRAYDDQAF